MSPSMTTVGIKATLAVSGDNQSFGAGANWSPDADTLIIMVQKDNVAGALEYEAEIDDGSTWSNVTDNANTQVRAETVDIPKQPYANFGGGATVRIHNTAGALVGRIWTWTLA